MIAKFLGSLRSGLLPTYQSEKIIFIGKNLTSNPFSVAVNSGVSPAVTMDLMQEITWSEIYKDLGYIGVTPSDELYFKYNCLINVQFGSWINAASTLTPPSLGCVDIDDPTKLYSALNLTNQGHNWGTSIGTTSKNVYFKNSNLPIQVYANTKLVFIGSTAVATVMSLRQLGALDKELSNIVISVVSVSV